MHHNSRLAFISACLVWCSFGSALAQPPREDALNRDGIRALEAGQYARALECFQAVERLRPGDLDVIFNVGLTYFRMGRYAEGITSLRAALASPSSAERARYLLGASLYQVRDYRTAAATLEPLRSSKYAEDVLYLLEESYRRSGQAEPAKRAFAEFMTRFPNSAELHKLLGIAYDSQGRYDEALKEFQQALDTDPHLPEVRFGIGFLHLKKHEDNQAAEWFQRELNISSCYAASYYYLGEIHRKAGDLPSAGSVYHKAIECDPALGEAHLGLGIVLEEQGQGAAALQHFREAARLAPKNSETHYRLAQALANAGLEQQARVEFAQVRKLKLADLRNAQARLMEESADPKLETLIK
jgi:tetratricopeptide (TPR) repeat protein